MGERDRANPSCLCWVHTCIQRKHTAMSSSWVKPQGDLCGFGPCFGEKKKTNPPITAMDFHENVKIFRLCYLQYLTENRWRCCLISATIPEQIISMLPLLANNFQFWNKPFLKSLALFRNYFAKMKHLKSSQFSTFPRSVGKGGLYL